VRALHEQGLNQHDIAERLRLSKSTVAFHMRRLHLPPDERFARRYDWSAIRAAYEGGMSMRQCRAKFGFSAEAWTDAIRKGVIVPRPNLIPFEELLVVGRRTNRGHLKKRLLKAGLKKNRCEKCGISEWQGQSLSMALHHVNGHGRDDRLSNIMFLCPNCHAQTENYGGRNGHRRRAPADAHAA
jgi:Winged helix-turn-helix DNA-binding